MFAFAACSGYDVEPLGNSADERLDQVQDQDRLTFAELLDIEACDRVAVVGAYTGNEQQRDLIGDANVDMELLDQFVVVVAFSGDEVIRAVRVGRTPLDLDWLAPRTFPCETTIVSDRGRAVAAGPVTRTGTG